MNKLYTSEIRPILTSIFYKFNQIEIILFNNYWLLSKKFLFYLFAISFILIAIFINEGYDDETFYGNDDEKREFKFFGN